jgi:hypothetical protein
MELLLDFVRWIIFTKLIYAIHKESELFEDLFQNLDVLIINRFMKQVV